VTTTQKVSTHANPPLGTEPGAEGLRTTASDVRATTEQLLDAAPDGMVIIDEAGVIRLVNRQAEALFGYERAELVGKPVEVLVPDRLAASHPDRRNTYVRNPSTRPMGAGLELTARHKDGSEFPVDISLSSLETDEGLLVSAAVRDIRDRRRSEQERAVLEMRLDQAQRELEGAVRAARLNQAERLESVGQLAGGIAHDFNNLLAAIVNYAGLVGDISELFTDASSTPALTVILEDVGEIKDIAKRAADLTDQLLIFSRREVLKLEVLDLSAIVSEMEKLLGRTTGEDIDLSTKLAPGLPKTRLDRGQVEQVVMNLVVNARDAMPRGGKLEIKTELFVVDEDYASHRGIAPGPYVRLAVSDTGSGMQPEIAERALEPFFTTKAKGKGSGLGLATVYGIATQAGGDVVIYSEPGLGTTVGVNFPVSGDDAPPLGGRPQEPRRSSEGEPSPAIPATFSTPLPEEGHASR
jgi:PAS domain S-box-containing protein